MGTSLDRPSWSSCMPRSRYREAMWYLVPINKDDKKKKNKINFFKLKNQVEINIKENCFVLVLNSQIDKISIRRDSNIIVLLNFLIL